MLSVLTGISASCTCKDLEQRAWSNYLCTFKLHKVHYNYCFLRWSCGGSGAPPPPPRPQMKIKYNFHSKISIFYKRAQTPHPSPGKKKSKIPFRLRKISKSTHSTLTTIWRKFNFAWCIWVNAGLLTGHQGFPQIYG